MPLRLPYTTPVYLTADIRRIEGLAAAQPDAPPLMERAGLAAAELARELVGDASRRILVLSGPGNNGGDAFVIARHLRQWWFDVTVVYSGDAGKLSADAARAARAWRDAGGTTCGAIPSGARWGFAIDGLFGIGLQRDVSGHYAALIEQINAIGAPVLAVDVPSGLDSDTGRVLGQAVRAAHTMTFIGLKAGLLTLDGPDHCGEIHLAALGLDAPAMLAPTGMISGPEILAGTCPARKLNTHKGSYGSVAIIGGAHGMVGAVLLAGRAALKLGAGRVQIGLLAASPLVDCVQPELMLRPAEELAAQEFLDCIAIGPGLSRSAAALALLDDVLGRAAPLVIDADGLNLIGAHAKLQGAVRDRTSPTLLTPHPAEAARLLACGTADVQRDRVAAARTLARTFNAGVVLKGAGSVCAWPDGTWAINVSGNPGMASAGMGDVLTGLIAALLAQGVEARRALLAAVYLHGAAADALVAAGTGPIGLAAGELIDAARSLINGRGA